MNENSSKKMTKWKKIKTEYPKVAMILKKAPITVGAISGGVAGLATGSGLIIPTVGGGIIGYEAKRTIKNFKKHGFSAPINDYTDATVGIGAGIVNAVINPNATIGNSIGLTAGGIMASKTIRHGAQYLPSAKTIISRKIKALATNNNINNIENKEAKWEETKIRANSYLTNNQCVPAANSLNLNKKNLRIFNKTKEIVNLPLNEDDKFTKFKDFFNSEEKISHLKLEPSINNAYLNLFSYAKKIVTTDEDKFEECVKKTNDLGKYWDSIKEYIEKYTDQNQYGKNSAVNVM